MISVEQIRLLESKVQKAVGTLGSLQDENTMLKSKLTDYEKRIDELEYLIEEFKEEQTEIEQGIISALNKLDSLESASRQIQAANQPVTIREESVNPVENSQINTPDSSPVHIEPDTEQSAEPDAETDGTTPSDLSDTDFQPEISESDETEKNVPDEIEPDNSDTEEARTIELDIF